MMFSVAVRDVLNRIAEQPEFYALVYEDLREAKVAGYPYCVYYRMEEGQVTVVAVFHTARDPATWQSRV